MVKILAKKEFLGEKNLILKGNFISHLEYYIYWAFMPFIFEWFFSDNLEYYTSVVAWSKLFFSYSKILGALFFGFLAIKYSPSKMLIYSFLGLTFFTFLLIFVPKYKSIGIFATYILITLRVAQSFFQGGEYVISNIRIMDLKQKSNIYEILEQKLPYNLTIMFAISFAYLIPTIISFFLVNMNHLIWRGVLILLVIVMVIICFTRNHYRNKIEYSSVLNIFSRDFFKKKIINFDFIIRFLRLTILNAFAYSIYVITFFFIDYFLAGINKNLQLTKLVSYNSYLLVLDIIIVFLFTKIIIYFKMNLQHILAFLSLLTIVIMIPIFRILPDLSYYSINMVKVFFVFLGVTTSLVQNVFSYQIIRHLQEKYLIHSLSYIVGHRLVGGSMAIIMWALWSKFHNTDFLAAVFIILAILNLIAVLGKIEHKDF
ncbi:MAG: MFS transporter [Rickettsia sp.]|nr:MFS transporter [Rickettsia sp.]